MNTPILLFALPLVATTPDQDVILKWSPAAGSAVEHHWLTGHQLFLDSFVRTVDDKRETRLLRWSVTSERTLVAVDELRRVSPTRPLEFRREYRTAEQSALLTPLGTEEVVSSEVKLLSPLAGTGVVWTWIEPEQDFGRYYDALEAEENLLVDLREDLHLRSLLPPGPVAIGETWNLDPVPLRDILDPGGELSLAAEEGDPAFLRSLGAGVGGSLQHAFSGAISGFASAKLEKVEDGRAHVQVRFDRLRYLSDISEYVKANRLRMEENAGVRTTGGTLIVDFTGTGTLIWNLSAGRADSFEMEVDEEVELSIRSAFDDSKAEEKMKMIGTFRGQYSAK